MLDTIERYAKVIITVFGAALILWIMFSFIEVNLKNLSAPETISQINFFTWFLGLK